MIQNLLTPPEGAIIIRVTERAEFKDCQRKWYYKYRINLIKREQEPDARHMGTAFHSIMAEYYTAIMMGAPIEEAQAAAWKLWAGVPTDDENDPDCESDSEWFIQPAWLGLEDAQKELIEGMIANYFKKYCDEDSKWEPKFVEQRLYAPVLIGNVEVWITGAIDLFTNIPERGNWIVDHKTYTNFLTAEQVDMSDQMNVYLWLCCQNGIQVRGAIYNMIRKKLPTVPKLLVKGGLSRAMNIVTDRDTYRQAIEDNGLDVADYADHLALLPEGEFFKRELVTRSPRWLASVGQYLKREAAEILEVGATGNAIPNFHRECVYCDYKSLCKTQTDQGDVKMLTAMEYKEHKSSIATIRES